jgi:hypothetical protein
MITNKTIYKGENIKFSDDLSLTSVVHRFLLLLSRVNLLGQIKVDGPVWAVLTKIIAKLHRREPLKQLLQNSEFRYGFYDRSFETELMFRLTEDQHQQNQNQQQQPSAWCTKQD